MENEIAGDGIEYENKKRILNEIFKPINLSGIQPENKNIEIVQEKLKDISVFRTSMDELIHILIGDGGK